MSLESIQMQVKDEMKLVEVFIQKLVNDTSHQESKQWMGYFFQSPGHRLRPLLTLLSYRLFSQELKTSELAIMLASLLELLHGASLIHDDVIDQESERRGSVTLNKMLNNKSAILIGNLFYLKSFELTLKLEDQYYLERIIHTAQTMCYGEVTQGISLIEKRKLSREKYLEIIEDKTGVLIGCCCELGAKLAGASEQKSLLMKTFGTDLGILYQIRDDLKDQDVMLESSWSLQSLFDDYRKKLAEHINHFPEHTVKESFQILVNMLTI